MQFSAYNIIFIFFCITTLVGVILYFFSYFVVLKNLDSEKISAYECGFDPFYDTTLPFNIKFYLVSILFIIFDLEVSFLFPWTITFLQIGFFGYLTMLVFLFILTLGFIYEWLSGALEWE
jgi:NADH-quinone oxidoreductase subunit A